MSRRAVIVLVAVLVACVGLLAVGRHHPRPPRPPATHATDALKALHSWDERRAAAYAHGSASELRQLYVPGSAAGRADVRILRGYQQRGLRITEMRMQVLALSVLESRPGRSRLQVTDRLLRATAEHGHLRISLPRDRPSTRVLTMVRGSDGRWRVSTVADAGV